MEIQITDRFAALSHPARLDVVRLLMRRHPDRVPAGEIAEVLGLKANTLSAHLSELNPMAVKMLEDKGYDTSVLRAKNVTEFQAEGAPEFDFVFTVCDRAANEECPTWPGQPLTAHWGTPDPVKAEGTEAERMLAFQQAYGMLRHRISAFAALPLGALDRIAQQTALDDIARQEGVE
jgi:protein-tyrosine-phosphatase